MVYEAIEAPLSWLVQDTDTLCESTPETVGCPIRGANACVVAYTGEEAGPKLARRRGSLQVEAESL
eukprot:756004-Hanusia_phi.AAC.2